jgi:hypothetical protein
MYVHFKVWGKNIFLHHGRESRACIYRCVHVYKPILKCKLTRHLSQRISNRQNIFLLTFIINLVKYFTKLSFVAHGMLLNRVIYFLCFCQRDCKVVQEPLNVQILMCPTYLEDQPMLLSCESDQWNKLFHRNPVLSPNFEATASLHFYSCSWASLACLPAKLETLSTRLTSSLVYV